MHPRTSRIAWFSTTENRSASVFYSISPVLSRDPFATSRCGFSGGAAPICASLATTITDHLELISGHRSSKQVAAQII